MKPQHLLPIPPLAAATCALAKEISPHLTASMPLTNNGTDGYVIAYAGQFLSR